MSLAGAIAGGFVGTVVLTSSLRFTQALGGDTGGVVVQGDIRLGR